MKGDALLAEQGTQALMGDVVDHPLGHQEVGQLGQTPGGNGRPCSAGLDLASFLISRRWPSVNFGGRPPLYLGYKDLNPSALKLWITSRTRSSLVKATFAIAAPAMPWADSKTICARRQVTTDPLSRRTIRTRRRPSSLSISRTRTRSATGPVWGDQALQQSARPGSGGRPGMQAIASLS